MYLLFASVTARLIINSSDIIHRREQSIHIGFMGIGLWPITIFDPNYGNQQPLYYCLSNFDSATDLALIVLDDIKFYSPYFAHSLLSLKVDLRT